MASATTSIAIAGSSGLIGTALVSALRAADRKVLRIVRRAPANSDELHWNPDAGPLDPGVLDGVDAVVNAVATESGDPRLVFFNGFSQGASMAYRAAVLGRGPSAGVIALGGDIPPELTREQLSRVPAVLIGWGVRDGFYDEEKRVADEARLRDAGVIYPSTVSRKELRDAALADAVEDLRERRGEPLHGQVAALVQHPRELARRCAARGGLVRGGGHGGRTFNGVFCHNALDNIVANLL